MPVFILESHLTFDTNLTKLTLDTEVWGVNKIDPSYAELIFPLTP